MLVVVFIKICAQSVRQRSQPVAEVRFFKAFLRPCRVERVSRGNNLPKLEGKEPEILKDDGKNGHILVVIIFPDIHAVEKNLALCRIVQPAEKFDKRRLARAVHPDDRQLFADPEFQVYMPQCITIRVRIPERNVAEFDIVLVIVAFFNGKRALIHVVWNIEIREIPPEIIMVLDRQLRGRHQIADRLDKHHQTGDVSGNRAHAHLARQRAGNHRGIRAELQPLLRDHARYAAKRLLIRLADLLRPVKLQRALEGFAYEFLHPVKPNLHTRAVIVHVRVFLVRAQVFMHASFPILALQPVMDRIETDRNRRRQHHAAHKRQFIRPGDRAQPKKRNRQRRRRN